MRSALQRLWVSTLLAGCFADPPEDSGSTDGDGSESTDPASSSAATAGTQTSAATEATTTDPATTDAMTSTPTTDATTGEASTDDTTGPSGDGMPPIATMIFPGPPGPLPSGAFPLVGGGFPQGEEAVATAELLVDDEVVASGDVVPMLWNPDDVSPGGAVSMESIGNTGYVEFVVTSHLTHKVIGLGTAAGGASGEDPYYRFHLSPNGNVFLRGFQPEGMYEAGDVFRIEVEDVTVRFLHNGNEIHSEPQTDPAALLYFDVMLNARASIDDPVISVDGGAAAAPTWTSIESLEVGVGFSATWDSSTARDGAHDFAVTLVDEGGDDATSDATESLVDNTPPSCAFVSPMDGDLVSGTVNVTMTASDANLSLTALYIDEGLVLQTEALEDVMYIWNLGVGSEGPHTLRFAVFDAAWTATYCEIDVTAG
jgi:hypothetical protein